MGDHEILRLLGASNSTMYSRFKRFESNNNQHFFIYYKKNINKVELTKKRNIEMVKKIMTEIEHMYIDQDYNKSDGLKDIVKMIRESSNRYTLLLGTDVPKTFIKTLLEEVFNGMGFKVEIKDDLNKLTIFLKNIVL